MKITYLGKKLFFNCLGANFLTPKSSHQREKQPVLTLFRIGGTKKPPLPVFPPVTSTNVGIRPQNFLAFSFNPFNRLV